MGPAPKRAHDPAAPKIAICYSRADSEIMAEIARHLTELGAEVWFDRQIGVGRNWRQEVIDAISEAEAVVVVLSSAATASEEIPKEVQWALDSKRTVFGIRVGAFAVNTPLSFLLRLTNQIDGHDAHGRRAACAAILKELRPLEPTDEVWVKAPTPGLRYANCPYLGPLHFRAEDEALFSGREKELAETLRLVEQRGAPLILLHGPSGTGKTSLLQAKLIPALKKAGYYAPAPLRITAPVLDDPADLNPRDVYVVEQITAPNETLVSALSGLQRKLQERRQELEKEFRGSVIIFDQFEELFNYGYPDRLISKCFTDLRHALDAFKRLRVVLVFREEYHGQVRRSYRGVGSTPNVPQFTEVTLERMDQRQAVEAIRKPARCRGVEFDAELAAAIAVELRRVKTPLNGVPIEKDIKDYVEPVQLQIVCRDIWMLIPEGRKVIDANELHAALNAGRGEAEAGGGRTSLDALLFDFIGDVLARFYRDVVNKTQEAAKAQERVYGLDLVMMGCLQFVTAGGHRSLVRLDERQRVGRLPFWVVKVLEDEHFLRADERGTATWYELAHDKLTEPVQNLRNQESLQLLLSLESLNAAMKRVQRGREGFQGVFEEHDSILRGLVKFQDQGGLFPEEAEFVFRSVLKSGTNLREWTRAHCRELEDSVIKALDDALHTENPADTQRDESVRVNAARAICSVLADPGFLRSSKHVEAWRLLEQKAFQHALVDPNEDVRQICGREFARIATPEHVKDLADRIRLQGSAQARGLLSRIRDWQERLGIVVHPAEGLKTAERLRLFLLAFRARSKESFRSVLLISLVSGLFTGIVTMSVRGLMASFHLTLTQAQTKAAMGMFHGLAGGVVWGSTVPFAIAYSWAVLYGGHPWKNSWRAVCTIGLSAVVGVTAGFVLTLMIINVFTGQALYDQGWLLDPQNNVLYDSLLKTGMGYTMIVQGVFVGFGLGFGFLGLCRRESWQQLMRSAVPSGQGVARQGPSPLGRLVRLAFPYSLIAAASLVVGGVILRALQQPGAGFRFPLGRLVWMIAGDAFSIYSGCLAALVGASYGYYLNVTGYTITARQEILPSETTGSPDSVGT